MSITCENLSKMRHTGKYRKLRLYECLTLPREWVVEDETTGELMILPATGDGSAWSSQRPYAGHKKALRPVWGYNWMGLGAPLLRPWAEVAKDSSGRN